MSGRLKSLLRVVLAAGLAIFASACLAQAQN